MYLLDGKCPKKTGLSPTVFQPCQSLPIDIKRNIHKHVCLDETLWNTTYNILLTHIFGIYAKGHQENRHHLRRKKCAPEFDNQNHN